MENLEQFHRLLSEHQINKDYFNTEDIFRFQKQLKDQTALLRGLRLQELEPLFFGTKERTKR
jgi:hypothetical protein